MTSEEKLISDLDSAGMSAEMLESMPNPEMYSLMMVNMQARINELEIETKENTLRLCLLIKMLDRKGLR